MSTTQPLEEPTLQQPPTAHQHHHNNTTTTTTTDLQRANRDATAAQIAYFRAIPWCAAHLSESPSTTTAPSSKLIIAQSISRRLSTTPEHALISRMLNNPSAIPAYVTFHRSPADPTALVHEVSALIALGPMVNGWAGVCHGGMVATLLDEAMAQVVVLNRERGLLAPEGVPMVAGSLGIKYLKPVMTGTVDKARVVLVTGRLGKVEGRRFGLEGEMRGEGGEVLARGEAVMFTLRVKL